MQRFTLVHDGSKQGWQTAYLAFHVAAQLGAPLLGLIVNTGADKDVLTKRAAQLEVGAHAAGVAIRTQLISKFSVDVVDEYLEEENAFFVPRRLIPDEKTARRFLDVVPCPLWLVSYGPAISGMAVLVGLPEEQEALLNYASVLSHRLKQTLTGLVLKGDLTQIPSTEVDFSWLILPEFSPSTVSAALNGVSVNLLFISRSQFRLSTELPLNCVFYPESRDT